MTPDLFLFVVGSARALLAIWFALEAPNLSIVRLLQSAGVINSVVSSSLFHHSSLFTHDVYVFCDYLIMC